jgi:hypothetical protein
MLVNFRFKNFKSFYNENNLSLQATKDNELEEINTFNVNKTLFNKTEQPELLKSAIIFGSNASGKSNVIKGITYMYNAIRLSSAQQIDVIKNNETFAFYENANNEISLYEVEIIQNNNLYKYGFTILQGKIEKEWLYKRNERTTIVFEREKNKLKLTGNELVQSLINIPETTLFLSIGSNFNLSISNYLKDVLDWFNNIIIVFENNANSLDIYSVENQKYKKLAIEILKKADIGIKNMTVVKDKIASLQDLNSVLAFNMQFQSNPNKYGQLKQENENMYNIDLDTQFNVYNNKNEKIATKDIMLFKDKGFHSEGTIRLLCYLGYILAALDKGKIIFIDEIDSKLHFLVADYLLKMFNSIDKNPNNSQLICTAHNIMLMDDDLRRDQIYFTSKDEYGVSSLVSLADYKGVRKNDLFSKKYLAGFYLKLPNLDR